MRNKWLWSFTEAWQMLVDIPLPGPLRNSEPDGYERQDTADLTLLCFPVVGLVVGLAAWLVCRFFLALAYPAGAAILAGITVAVMLEIFFSARNLAALISFVENMFTTGKFKKALLELNNNFREVYGSPLASLTVVITMLLRLALIGLVVYYQAPAWLIIVIILNLTAQAQLAMTKKIGAFEPVLEVQDEKSPLLTWGLAALLLIVVGHNCLQAALTAFVIAFCFAMLFQRYCEEKLDGLNPRIICLAGYTLETLLLLIGLMLLLKK